MQSYPLNLSAGARTSFQTKAQRFVYESGVNATQGDARIVVTPDNGNEITLRAGQSFKLPDGFDASIWNVRANDPTAAITGAIIIGSGEFEDNSFKIDANSGSVPVVLMNDAAHRVPVSLDSTSIIQQSPPIMDYTNAYFQTSISIPATAGGLQIIDPATNVRGIILSLYELSSVQHTSAAAAGLLLVAAKATPPYWYTAGSEVLAYKPVSQTPVDVFMPDISKRPLIMLPAGKGLWLMSNSSMILANATLFQWKVL